MKQSEADKRRHVLIRGRGVTAAQRAFTSPGGGSNPTRVTFDSEKGRKLAVANLSERLGRATDSLRPPEEGGVRGGRLSPKVLATFGYDS